MQHDWGLICTLSWAKDSLNCVTNVSLQWCHNQRDGVSNHQPHDCLLNRLFRRRSKKTPKLCVTGLCLGNSPGTCEFPAQMANNAENVSIWWRHHVKWAIRYSWICFVGNSVTIKMGDETRSTDVVCPPIVCHSSTYGYHHRQAKYSCKIGRVNSGTGHRSRKNLFWSGYLILALKASLHTPPSLRMH